MSIEKAEIKRGTAHEIGTKLDDALDAATRNLHRLEGTHEGLKLGVTRIEALLAEVDQEVENKTLDLPKAKIAKTHIAKAMATIAEMATAAKREHVVAQGRVQGLELSVKLTKIIYDSEDNKCMLSSKPGKKRKTGERPSPSIKKRRGRKPKAKP